VPHVPGEPSLPATLGRDELTALLERHELQAAADLRSHADAQQPDARKVDAYVGHPATSELIKKVARKRAAVELGIDGVREAQLLVAEMGYRRARKYANDPSILQAYLAMDAVREFFKLVCVRDVLDEMRSQMPWHRRVLT
jgi:hypothetical protein